MEDCIFCKIAEHEIESEIVYEDNLVVAFKDLNPAAKIHILIVPKTHVKNIYEVSSHPKGAKIMQGIMEAITKVADLFNIADAFRIVVNNGEKAGQTIFHLHFHLLGGQELPISVL